MTHMSWSLTSDLDQICKVMVFVRGRFQSARHCSNLKFRMRIYIYNKYNRNIQDSGHDDLYVMVH